MGRNLDTDDEPTIVFIDAEGGELSAELSYPSKHFTHSSMERFSQSLLTFIKVLLDEPDTRLNDVPVTQHRGDTAGSV